MADKKAFWLSKTFWAGLISTVFALLKYFDLIPDALNEKEFTEFVMMVIGIVVIQGRSTASGPLSLTQPPK